MAYCVCTYVAMYEVDQAFNYTFYLGSFVRKTHNVTTNLYTKQCMDDSLDYH